MAKLNNGLHVVKTEDEIYYENEDGMRFYDAGERHGGLVPVKEKKGDSWKFLDDWGDLSCDSYPMVKWLESKGFWAVEDESGGRSRDSYGILGPSFLSIQQLENSKFDSTQNGFGSFAPKGQDDESEM